MNNDEKNGCAATIFMAVMIFILGLAIGTKFGNEIRSNNKIKPEIKLTTDGKIIDTIYIYKKQT